MNAADWGALIEQAAGDRHLRQARSLLEFLQRQECSRLDEEAVQGWLQERLQRGAGLESALVLLTPADKLAKILAGKGIADPTVVTGLRKNPDLLKHLTGGRPQVPTHWQPIIADFETSLKGLCPLHQARCLSAAARFIAALGEQGSPDEPGLMRWLERELASYTMSTAQLSFARIERFCQFLQTIGHPGNPAREWRNRHQGLFRALRCLKAGEAPPLREPRYQSFLATHIEAFIAFKRSLGRQYRYVHYVDRLGSFAGTRGLSDVRQVDRQAILAYLATGTWSTATRREVQATLKQFFRFLCRSGLIDASPAEHLPRLRRPPRLPRILSVREIAAVLQALDHASTQDFNRSAYSAMVLLLYSCGLRRREAVRLRFGDVDLKGGVLFIHCTKFGKDRRIPIGPRVAERLHDYCRSRVERLGLPESDAPFFVQAIGDPVNPGNLGRVYRDACARAGLRPGARLHDLRHTFAVHRLYKWYLDGVDLESRLPLLSIYMGHVSGDSTRHYLNLSQDLLRLAGRPMERNLESWLPEEHDEP